MRKILTALLAMAPEPWQCTWCGALNHGLSQACWKCGAGRT